MSNRVPVIVAFLATVSLPQNAAHGQAVQAVQSARAVVENITAELDTVRRQRGLYRDLLAVTDPEAQASLPANRRLISDALEAATRALEARDDPARFAREYRTFVEADQAVMKAIPTAELERLGYKDQEIRLRSIVPQIQTAAPNVSFVLSLDYNTTTDDDIGVVGLHTNLLGAAAGAAFDALGSDDLKQYFTNNTSAGTTIPFGGASKLAAQIGFGLGGVSLGPLTFWPAVNLEQTDSADARVPASLRTRLPDVKNWSSPSLAIAIVPTQFISRMQKGRAAALLTLGLRLPYFYPGDPFSGLAAMFSAKRNDFEKEGKVHFIGGVSIPLFRVEPPKKADEVPAAVPAD